MHERVGHEPRPLLPDALEGRLVGGLSRVAGLALVSAALAGWLSLISWSARDPSLTHATGGLARNWLGPLGAILSDLLLQTLGFVAIFAFLGLASWGIELILSERIDRLKMRLGIFPFAVLVLAGAFSSLPAPPSWPLNHGLGGIAGDTAFGFLAGLLAIINPARAGVVTGLLLFTGGMCLLSSGLGLAQRDWAILVQPDRTRGTRPGFLKRWLGTRPMRQEAAPSHQGDASGGSNPAGQHGAAQHGRERSPETASGVADTAMLATRAASSAASARDTIEEASDRRDGSFDHFTERASRTMAERFAPAREPEAEPRGPSAPVAQKAAGLFSGLVSFKPSEPQWRRPSLNILKRPAAPRPGPEFTQPVLRGSARLLEDVLADFSVKGEVKDIRPGPVVTLFELEPARGTKTSRVIALADDIARSMSAVSARVAVVPGRNAIGIELPNMRRETVLLRDVLESEAWRRTDAQLAIVLGKGIGGEPVIADLARMPHLLIAGTTGSGKSVGVNAMILSLLFRLSPAECRLLLIDPKMLELSVYNGIPHLLAPVIVDPHRAAAALTWAVSEMEERYKRMALLGVRNIEFFNNRVKNAKKRGELMGRTVQTGFDERTGAPILVTEEHDLEPMPFIVIVVDEFADLMAVAGKEIEGSLQRLAQMARAAGIHLVMATQRPSVDVVTGTIKANFPTRIAFKVASKIDSRTILNEQGAEQLLGAGDMLYAAGAGQPVRVHGPFVSDEEVERVAEALRAEGEPNYVAALLRDSPLTGEGNPAAQSSREIAAQSEADDLFDRAVAIVHRDQKASTSYLQRRLGVGYNRAAGLIDRMEQEGLISPADAVGRRRVLMGAGDDTGG